MVEATEKWGVDPAPGKIPGRDPEEVYTKLFRQTSDDFFESLADPERFDVVLIDGLHLKEQVYRDATNSLRHLTNRGLLVLHDCSPENEAMQIVPRRQKHWNGDCWKALVRLRSEHPELFCRVIAEDQGVGVVIPRPPGKLITDLILDKTAFDLQYSDLEADRKRLLGVVNFSDIERLREEASS